MVVQRESLIFCSIGDGRWYHIDLEPLARRSQEVKSYDMMRRDSVSFLDRWLYLDSINVVLIIGLKHPITPSNLNRLC